jgi:hypothetical protein
LAVILESAAAMTREVWFLLVDKEGNAVARSADRVKDLPDTAVVVDVRDAVKAQVRGQSPRRDCPIGSHSLRAPGGLRREAGVAQGVITSDRSRKG